MGYDAETIANAFYKISREHGYGLTPMKLQKLLYFAQGHALSLSRRGMITDDCNCWKYGPAFPCVYFGLGGYGSRSIDAMIVDKESPDRFNPDRQLGEMDWRLVRAVWKNYGHLDVSYLSELTRSPDGPWAKTCEKIMPGSDDVISKNEICRYFETLLSPARRALLLRQKSMFADDGVGTMNAQIDRPKK